MHLSFDVSVYVCALVERMCASSCACEYVYLCMLTCACERVSVRVHEHGSCEICMCMSNMRNRIEGARECARKRAYLCLLYRRVTAAAKQFRCSTTWSDSHATNMRVWSVQLAALALYVMASRMRNQVYDRDTRNDCRTTHSHGLARLCVKNYKSSYTSAEDHSSRLPTQEIKSSSRTKSPAVHT